MKLFQHDTKTWEDGDRDEVWQFLIVRKRALFQVWNENPSRTSYSTGGLHLLLGFFTSSHLFGVDILQDSFPAWSFYLFSEYFEGYDD